MSRSGLRLSRLRWLSQPSRLGESRLGESRLGERHRTRGSEAPRGVWKEVGAQHEEEDARNDDHAQNVHRLESCLLRHAARLHFSH